jgi:hypothetical protein
VIVEKPLEVCGRKKFRVDVLGDHLCTCTTHSVAKKAHDWVVNQLVDLFHTETGPVPLILDLRVAY